MSLSLRHCWERTVVRAPSAIALVDAASGRQWTRQEIDQRASGWVEAHRAQLAQPRRTVIYSLSNGIDWLTLFLGILKSDYIAVPLDPGEPVAHREYIARRLGAAWLWDGAVLTAVAHREPARRDGRCLIKLTSGSTGVPRALAFTDAQMLADGRQVMAGMRLRGKDINFGLVPFGHSYGLGNLVVPLLTHGMAIVCGSSPWPHVVAEEIARFRPTVFPAVPTLLRALAESAIPPAALSSLRTIISAGAPLPGQLAANFEAKFGRRIHNFYGSSETGGIAFDRKGDARDSVGRPLPGVHIIPAAGGRFCVASAAVYTIGNRRREGALGAFRPADRGAIEGGCLRLEGRLGRTVKLAGRRLELGEVERALRNVSGVTDAWVQPAPDREGALQAAVASLRPAGDIRRELREILAAWKIPRKILTLPQLPQTSRGKTDAVRLAALVAL